MAKFELRFLDCFENEENYYVQTEATDTFEAFVKEGKFISIFGKNGEDEFCICLDKSTAIKFAKTLRTEINKITESEVNNG